MLWVAQEKEEEEWMEFALHARSGAAMYGGQGSIFQRRCVHGVLVLGLVSALVGTRLPGPGAVLLHHNIAYRNPVYTGDRVTAQGEVSLVVL